MKTCDTSAAELTDVVAHLCALGKQVHTLSQGERQGVQLKEPCPSEELQMVLF